MGPTRATLGFAKAGEPSTGVEQRALQGRRDERRFEKSED